MWLIDEHAGRELAAARRSGVGFSAEQRTSIEQSIVAMDGDPRGMVRAGSTAEIFVEGVLTEKPDFFAMFFGGGNTLYPSIAKALAIAASDISIKDVVFRINSPGGTIAGLFETLGAIERFKADSGKRVSVVATSALSAAYAIAAVAGNISAATAASTFGSIGVAVDFTVWDGETNVSITNSASPDKRPDLTTEAGRAVMVEHLDALYDIFADAIARGRGVKAEDIGERFGRGRTFTAAEAKQRGMIDALPKSNTRPALRAVAIDEVTPESVGAHKRTPMDLETLRAQHPDVFKAAAAEGCTVERDRVIAHLTMGAACGDMEIAHGAIKAGSVMTTTLQAEYMAAGMKRSQVGARQDDSNAAGNVLDGAAPAKSEPTATDAGDILVAALKAKQVIA